MVSDRVSRRTFVGSLTVAGSIGLAGCGGLGGNGGDGGNGGNGGGDTPADENGTSPTEENETSPTEEETEEPTEEASLELRGVHAVVGAPEVDVYVDDELAFEGLTYADVTGYENVGTGDSEVRITAAGDESQVLFENQLDVEDQGYYSLVAFGEFDSQQSGGTATPEGGSSSSLQVVSLDDEVAEGQDTQMRAFHASPDADPIDVTTANAEEPIVTDLGYRELSDYGSVEAGVQTIEVMAAGEDEVLAEVDADFQEGLPHTAFVMGSAEAEESSEEALRIVAALDGPTDAESGGQSSAGTGNETGNETSANESSMGNETETSA